LAVVAPAFAGDCLEKPGAPIRLTHAEAIQFAPGETRELQLQFSLPADVRRLELRLHPQSHLQLLSQQQHWVFSGPGIQPVVKLTLKAEKAGNHSLMFSAATWSGDADESSPMSRVLGVAVRVESIQRLFAAQKPGGIERANVKSLPSGRAHWMPAQENKPQ